MTAPGVNVTTALRTGPASAPAPELATWFLLAATPVGSLEPRVTTDQATALQAFDPSLLAAVNGATAALAAASRAQVAAFYEEGGQRLIEQRVVGANAEAAELTLLDADGDPSLTLTAAYVGEWGNHLRVAVAAGTTGGTKKVTISVDTATAVGVFDPDEPIVLDNLADKAAIVAALVTVANLLETYSGVRWLEVTEGEGLIPANIAATNLAGGDSDLDASLSNVDNLIPDASYGPGVVSVTGGFTLAAFTGHEQDLVDIAAKLRQTRRIMLIDPPLLAGIALEDSAAVLADLRAELEDGTEKYGMTVDEILGRFVMVAPVSARQDGYRVASSGTGYVAGVRARTIASYGPHRAPAGEVSDARYIDGPIFSTLGAVAAITDDQAASLYDAGINPIRIIGGKVRLYGWRTLADPSSEWFSASAVDTLNGLAADADTRAESLMFRPIDTKGHLFAELRGLLIGIAEEAKAAGAIFPLVDDNGVEQDPGYSVDVSGNVNTPETIALGQVNGVLNVRLAPNAATVNITVTKVAVGAAI